MDIEVSINCITYNHEKYISQAIESFLMQKTNFRYEIIIGEDCSSDSTRDIILYYQKKYPDIIKVIISEKNVGGFKNATRVREASIGKYIAACEGDDYWTDPNKLQKQYDYMERNSSCSSCFHSARIAHDMALTNRKARPYKKNVIVPVEKIITKGGSLFPTASLFFKREVFDKLPDWYYQSPVGDYPLVLMLALSGEVHYIDEEMSVYRLNVSNSWTRRVFNRKDSLIEHRKKIVNMLEGFNIYTSNKYSKFVNDKISEVRLSIIKLENRESGTNLILNKTEKELLRKMRIHRRIRFYIKRIIDSFRNKGDKYAQ